MSGSWPRATDPRAERPWKKRRRRNTACSARNATSARVQASRSVSTADQSYQEIELSWQ
jgi:hypothetical protein